MDDIHFDALTRSLSAGTSRRRFGRVLVGGGLIALLGPAFGPLTVDARKKRHKKRKQQRSTPHPPPRPPLVFNQYGCIAVGQPCRGDSNNCCSGICQGAAPTNGRPDQSRGLAHDTGTCRQDVEGACTTSDPMLAPCNGRAECACVRTTAGSNYCAAPFTGPGTSQCVSCQRDADCLAAGLPRESACAPVSAGRCAEACPNGMACLAPCGAVSPPPQM